MARYHGNDSLNDLIDILNNREQAEIDAENKLLELKKSHIEELANLQIANITKVKKANLIASEEDLKKRLKALEVEQKKATQLAKLKESREKRGKTGDGHLTAAEKKKIEKQVADEYKIKAKYQEKLLREGKKLERTLAKQQDYERVQENAKTLSSIFGLKSGMTWTERKAAWGSTFKNDKGETQWGSVLASAITSLSDYAASLKQNINEIASMKGIVDTRMQGSRSSTFAGSYWDRISKNIKNAATISPLVSQSDIASQVKTMVSKGITFNVEQRAFLAAISDRIAASFNATDQTLLQLVRIQQKDTTAGRLGMESALTSFLNNMYETTEYMEDLASRTRSNLLEAQALMTATNATQFEYQVQKWAGSLYSVGMNSSSVSSITSALGQLASGDISGINNGGVGNLLVMAANNAGLSIAEILQNGLDDSETNDLMKAMVNYLAGIYNETKGSKVVAQQYANVFGLKASDLLAASNLSSSVNTVSKNGLSYSGMLGQLTGMANSMYARTSIGEMLGNVASNFQYTMAAGIANNPALYALYTASNMLSDLTGGINFGTPLVMGTGLASTFNVADIMRAGALSGSILSGIGEMIASGSNGGVTGANLLKSFGITGGTTNVTRGTGYGLAGTNGISYSSSGFVGNSEGGDVYNKTMTDATDEANQQVASAVDSSEETTLSVVDEHVVNIYNLLQEVVSGTSNLHVSFGNEFTWSK